jgi:hypothetical protein
LTKNLIFTLNRFGVSVFAEKNKRFWAKDWGINRVVFEAV